jgi:hypothetical protein
MSYQRGAHFQRLDQNPLIDKAFLSGWYAYPLSQGGLAAKCLRFLI